MSLKEFIIKKRFLIIGVLVALLSGGGFLGWKMLTAEQTPEEYVEQLNLAMTAGDFATLVALVDFRALTEDAAKKILETPPVSELSTPKEKTVPELAHKIEQIFIESMKNRGIKPVVSPMQKKGPPTALLPLPKDIAEQITGKFTLRGVSKQGAIATVSFKHPEMDEEIPLHFLIEQVPQWKMVRLINMPDLIKMYQEEEKNLERARKKEYELKRAKDKKRMNQQFKLDSCTAFVHKPAGQKTPLLTVRIRGYNNGPFTIRNITFDTKVIIHTSGGELIYKHDINTASQLRVGTNLEDSYTLDLEEGEKQVEMLMNASRITCEALTQYMTLDNGEVLFLEKETGFIETPRIKSKEAEKKEEPKPTDATAPNSPKESSNEKK